MVILSSAAVKAQPNPGATAEGAAVEGQPIGGGAAPVGSGIVITLGLAVGYASKKVIRLNCKKAKQKHNSSPVFPC